MASRLFPILVALLATQGFLQGNTQECGEDEPWIHPFQTHDFKWSATNSEASLSTGKIPTQARLAIIAEQINRSLFVRNSDPIRKMNPPANVLAALEAEERFDCVAISISKTGTTGVISGNVKMRINWRGTEKIRFDYGTLGIEEPHRDFFETELLKYPELSGVTFDIIGRATPPANCYENALLHAEMQQLVYGVHGTTSIMSVSKEPCIKCEGELRKIPEYGFSDYVGFPGSGQNRNPNWVFPQENQIVRKFTISAKKVERGRA